MTRILLVNDEPSVRDVMGACFSHIGGFNLEFAADGDDAVRLCGERTFDPVLTDYAHPGPCGAELVKRIREKTADQPIAFLTGLDEQRMRDLEQELAPFGVPLWNAPVPTKELSNRISSFLKQQLTKP